MLFLRRTFQGPRAKQRPSEGPKACETKMPRNRDDERARTLLLALGKLERTMDPLIAAQAYDNGFCPLISRLPEELLLCILDFMRDDFPALLCLRITSRIFFRLPNSERIYLWGSSTCSLRGEAFDLRNSSRLRFRQLSQRDGRCYSCKRWNDAHAQVLKDCKFQQTDRGTGSRSRFYCNACDSHHDFLQFSSGLLWRQSKRYCLGQQGVLQLCAYVSISWASIKAHVDEWRKNQRGEGDWQDCLNSFKITCYYPSHDTRCMGPKAPTRPQARLVTSTRDPNIVVLDLEWEPHGSFATLAVTADGRVPAQQLRGLFQKIRNRGPAATPYPSSHSGAIPEMAFFSPALRTSQLIHYETGEGDIPRHTPELSRSFCLPSPLSWDYRHGVGRNGTKLNLTLHCPSDAVSTISSHCRVIRYEKDIMVCTIRALIDFSVKINPTDHWLHATDTKSYTHPQGNSVRPQCKDVACVNHYQKRKDSYHCPAYFDASQ
jgi:hypothetical protein